MVDLTLSEIQDALQEVDSESLTPLHISILRNITIRNPLIIRID